MAISYSKYGAFYPYGSVSFSSLRNNFKETTSGSIKASELLRDTVSDNPIVPDAVENEIIPTTRENLKISSLRNAVKYYDFDQYSIDDNEGNTTQAGLNLNNLQWNNSLLRSVKKRVNIKGIVGSVNYQQPAIFFNLPSKNVEINVSGAVYGSSAPARSAEDYDTYISSGFIHYFNNTIDADLSGTTTYDYTAGGIVTTPSQYVDITSEAKSAPDGLFSVSTGAKHYSIVFKTPLKSNTYVIQPIVVNKIAAGGRTTANMVIASLDNAYKTVNGFRAWFQDQNFFPRPNGYVRDHRYIITDRNKNGLKGGDCFELNSTTNVRVNLLPTGKVYAGGGSGCRGLDGQYGNTSLCSGGYFSVGDFGGLGGQGGTGQGFRSFTRFTATFTITSTDVFEGGVTTANTLYKGPGYTNTSPQLSWSVSGLPAGVTVRSYSVFMESYNTQDFIYSGTTVSGQKYLHWGLTDIDSSVTSITPGSGLPLGATSVLTPGSSYVNVDGYSGLYSPNSVLLNNLVPGTSTATPVRITVLAYLNGSDSVLTKTFDFYADAGLSNDFSGTLQSSYTTSLVGYDPNVNNYIQTALRGATGGAGGIGGCPLGGAGVAGSPGGNGGDWAQAGQQALDLIGTPGAGGLAVTGSNFTVSGTINSETIRGSY